MNYTSEIWPLGPCAIPYLKSRLGFSNLYSVSLFLHLCLSLSTALCMNTCVINFLMTSMSSLSFPVLKNSFLSIFFSIQSCWPSTSVATISQKQEQGDVSPFGIHQSFWDPRSIMTPLQVRGPLNYFKFRRKKYIKPYARLCGS